MSKRYDINDYPADEPEQLRRAQQQRRRGAGDGHAPVSAGAAIRQRQQQSQRAQQGARRDATASRGRLNYDNVVNDHGQRSSQRTARDYDRNRYAGKHSRSAAETGRQQQVASRRHVELDQSGQIPRYVPQNDPRSRQQIAAQRNRNAQQLSQGANRFARNNGNYQARPDKMGNAASSVQGALDTPFSMIIRVALIVILVAFFGIRFALSAGPAAQLKEVQATVATQQEELDKITAENKALEDGISSRQSTIDAYDKLVKSQS